MTRRTATLERLAAEIAEAQRLGMVPGPAAVDRWHGWAQDLLAEADTEWLLEPAFRLRTGAAARWCSRHYTQYEAEGRARRNSQGKREWHASVRLPRRAPASDPAALVNEIASSFRVAS